MEVEKLNLIENKKLEILNFLKKNFDVEATHGRGSHQNPYDVVYKSSFEKYCNLRRTRERKLKKKWREDRSVWIRILNVDDEKRGVGLAIHIKSEISPWSSGRSNYDKKHYEKWNLPYKSNNYHFRVSHGNELIFSIIGNGIIEFDPEDEYFIEYLKFAFSVFTKNINSNSENVIKSKGTSLKVSTHNLSEEEKRDNIFQNELEQIIRKSKEKFINEIEYKPKPKKEFSIVKNIVENREKAVAVKSLSLANYQCEIDNSHITFISKVSKMNYVEAHHLIPISVSNDFLFSLDIEANVVALCPNCHRKIHHGERQEVFNLLEILYKSREENLKKCGIKISMNRLRGYYINTD